MLAFFLVSCNNTEENSELTGENEVKVEKIKVTTSIVPLASIVNYIGGNLVKAESLVPAWVSPHGFDLKPNQIVSIEKSDLIVYLDLDHVDGFLNKSIEEKNNIIAVKEGIKLLEAKWHDHSDHEDEHNEDEHHEDEHHEDEHHEDEHHEDENHSTDPHIWGSAENAYLIAKTILNELVKISPEDKNYFNSNLESFKAELESVKVNFESNINEKQQGDFIVFHDAYNYLFAELNIDSNKKHVFRNSELSDPNSKEVKFLIDEIKELSIKTAYKEPQLDSNNLKKIASDYNLGIYVLDPIWNDTSKDWYIKNYKANLESLEKIYE